MLRKLLQEKLSLASAMISMIRDAVRGFVAEDKKRLARKAEPKPGTPAARKAKREKNKNDKATRNPRTQNPR